MKRASFSKRPARWVLGATVLVAALTAVACGNSMKFSPTQPDWPLVEPQSGRSLQISGTLVAEQGSCLEATVLFDGQEIEGARVICAKAKGCATLKMQASLITDVGHHTISFQVLRQSAEVVDYMAKGAILVSRDGLALGGVTLPLGPTPASLNPGGMVSFEFELRN